jgi:Tfp pilus assembly PilM family ATPase
MEQRGCLGIYIGSDRLTAAVVSKTAAGWQIQYALCVQAEAGQEVSYAALADALAKKLAERQIVFSEAAAAIDGTLFRSQSVHSEFTDAKQIAQTIKFDAEEVLSVDAAETAVAFEIISKGANGSEATVFASSASRVSNIITAFGQQKGLDPVTIEPDTICFRRFIDEIFSRPADSRTIWAGLSRTNCYVIMPTPAKGRANVRGFLTLPNQDKAALLTREITMMLAAGAGAALTTRS